MGIAVRIGFAGAALCVLAACGGGGGGGSSAPAQSRQSGRRRHLHARRLPAHRADPRGPVHSAFNEKMFLRSWTNDLYLWFAEVPDTNPNSIADVIDVFRRAQDAAADAVEQSQGPLPFRRSIPTSGIALSQSGQSIGYGAELMIIGDGLPPRRAVVAFVEPGTPASNAA